MRRTFVYERRTRVEVSARALFDRHARPGAFGRALGRPAPFAVPAPALRLLLGEFADEGLLGSTRAVPAKLTASGFAFRYAGIDDALRHGFGRETA